MSIKNYIIEFERLFAKTKAHGSTMSEDILAYRLLRSANISEHHEQLARATIPKLTYDCIKAQLTKIFNDPCTDSGSDFSVKIEGINLASGSYNSPPGTHYGNNARGTRGSYYQRNSDRNNFGRNRGGYRNINRGGTKHKRGKNPVNDQGFVSRCSVCESINHWAANCPDATYYAEEFEDTYDDCDGQLEHHVTLFQSAFIGESAMKTFVAESFSSAILDSGASSTVSGKTWVDCYVDGLSSQSQDKVSYSSSLNNFKFGSGSV